MAAQGAPSQIPIPNTTPPEYLLQTAQILLTHLRQLGVGHVLESGPEAARYKVPPTSENNKKWDTEPRSPGRNIILPFTKGCILSV